MTFSNSYWKLQFAIKKNGDVECSEYPDLFFPEDHPQPTSSGMSAIAIQICKRCPVQELCLDYAIESKIEYGIWGGSLPKDR